MEAVRKLYEKYGVDKYYQRHHGDYQNPHLDLIRELLRQNASRLDYSNVLDLCCGNGEVSSLLMEMGYPEVAGCDPYTFREYMKATGKPCFKYSFDDLIRGRLTGSYSSVICSFGMHLCPEEKLFPLVSNLFALTTNIIIITPHKRPELEKLGLATLAFEDYALTSKGKKVRLKSYQRTY